MDYLHIKISNTKTLVLTEHEADKLLNTLLARLDDVIDTEHNLKDMVKVSYMTHKKYFDYPYIYKTRLYQRVG